MPSSSAASTSLAVAMRSHHLTWPHNRPPPAEAVAAGPRRWPRAEQAVRAPPPQPQPQPVKSCLASMWRRIQGADDWSGLVEPLDPLLREEVVRYGELVAACYKAFDLDPGSKRYLNCKYGKSSMLREVGLAGAGYVITKYIYATPDIGLPAAPGGGRCGRWIGYVAVASDDEARRLGRRDVVVSFRGTVTGAEWVANLMSSLTPANLDPHGSGGADDVRVESGFLSLYTSDDSSCRFSHGSCREQLLGELARLVAEHGNEEEMSITVAGHSMGAALALLLGYDVAELGLNRPRRRYGRRQAEPPIPVTVYSFGGPRVGNSGFKRRCEELGVKVLRVVNVHDPVTKLPGLFLNERWGGRWGGACYAHVGVELALEFFKVQNPASVHDLETYIGLLRCPSKAARVGRDGGVDLLERAMKTMRKQKLQGWPWQDVARHVGDLVQSLSLI